MMKKRWLMFLALMMMVGCVGCGNKEEKQTEATTTEAATTEAATTEAATTEEVTTEAATTEAATEDLAAFPETEVENPITYFQMTLADDAETMYYLSASLMDGEVTVEYVGEEKKVGTFEPAVLHGITAVVDELKLADLNGQDVYGDGEAFASMYINYANDDYLSASFSGTIAEEYIAAYEDMAKRFQNLTKELPVYVPQPMVNGEVDETVLAEMMEILNQSGMEGLDTLAIDNVPMDEYFAMTVGLSKNDGIVNGTNCYPMMSSIAYSMVIVTVEDAESIKAVREDFESSMDWNKWICVSASNALIAEKDHMVICLMGSDSVYEQTAQAIEAAGWSDLQHLENTNQ